MYQLPQDPSEVDYEVTDLCEVSGQFLLNQLFSFQCWIRQDMSCLRELKKDGLVQEKQSGAFTSSSSRSVSQMLKVLLNKTSGIFYHFVSYCFSTVKCANSEDCR